MIYVDNSATTFFKPDEVKNAVLDYLSHPASTSRGIGENAFNASQLVLDTRIKIASFFDFPYFDHVVFTSGITESLNIVIQGLINQDDHVITSIYEHNSVLRPLYHQTNDISFFKEYSELDSLLKDNTKALILNHASNVTGDIQPIKEIGLWCHQHHILFIVDSAQSAGIIPISMKDNYIDILCFTGHKGLLAIQGIGGLCIQKGIEISPLKYGGTGILSFEKDQPISYPDHLEAGTLNIPGIVSLNASLDYVQNKGIENIFQHENKLAHLFYNSIKDIKNIKIYGEFDNSFHRVGIISINIINLDAALFADELYRKYQIETRAGAHCAPLIHQYYQTSSQVRFSFGLNNTEEDVYCCIQAVQSIAKEHEL